MTDANIQIEVDADGVLLARIDMPGRTMNVFSGDMMDSLEALLNRVAGEAAVKAVVLTSGKPAFLAGADLEMIKMFTERARTGTTAELNALFGRLGRLFRRLELSHKPFVAAINGLALGGGLEVCLACHQRVVADAAGVQLGLPEVKLGLLPGAGGTQRLPRLVGTRRGLEMLLGGEPVAPAEALQIGLVDEVVAPDQLIGAARRRALALKEPRARWDVHGASFDASPFDFAAPQAAATIGRTLGISDYQLRYYPAYHAILDCVIGGWKLPMTEAGEHEMRVFVELMRDPVAGNMVRSLFLNRQKAAKAGLLAPSSPLAAADSLLPAVKAAREQAEAAGCSEEETLLGLSLAAARIWQRGGIEQPELADVAVVAAGLFPSYAGGPFNYLRQLGAEAVRRGAAAAASRHATLFALPEGLGALLQA